MPGCDCSSAVLGSKSHLRIMDFMKKNWRVVCRALAGRRVCATLSRQRSPRARGLLSTKGMTVTKLNNLNSGITCTLTQVNINRLRLVSFSMISVAGLGHRRCFVRRVKVCGASTLGSLLLGVGPCLSVHASYMGIASSGLRRLFTSTAVIYRTFSGPRTGTVLIGKVLRRFPRGGLMSTAKVTNCKDDGAVVAGQVVGGFCLYNSNIATPACNRKLVTPHITVYTTRRTGVVAQLVLNRRRVWGCGGRKALL